MASPSSFFVVPRRWCLLSWIFLFLLLLSPPSTCFSLSTSSSTTLSDLSSSSSELTELVSKGLLVQPLPNLYVLGTIHIGSKSADDVTLLLNTVQPSTVVLELSPSRLSSIMLLLLLESKQKKKKKQPQKMPQRSVLQEIGTLPSFALTGLSIAGIPGMMVMVVLLWSSLVQQAWQMKDQQHNDKDDPATFKTVSEFDTAVMIVATKNATVVAADWELPELVEKLAAFLTVQDWIQLLWGGFVLEPLGLQPKDPITQRKSNNNKHNNSNNKESAMEWEERRRDISSARASLQHKQKYYGPAVDTVLVHQRNQRFAEFCVKELLCGPNKEAEEEEAETMEGEEEKRNDSRSRSQPIVVCIVGLAHLDGVAEICQELATNQPTNHMK